MLPDPSRNVPRTGQELVDRQIVLQDIIYIKYEFFAINKTNILQNLQLEE